MSEIVRVPFEQSGVHDSVELVASCAYSEFSCDEAGNPAELKGPPVIHPCKIMASYEDGTVSVSARNVGVMLSVRIEEMIAVLRDAGIASLESADPVRPKEGGPFSLYCHRCRCWVPDTANAEMKKEGCFAHSHSCGHRSPREVYEEDANVQEDAATQG